MSEQEEEAELQALIERVLNGSLAEAMVAQGKAVGLHLLDGSATAERVALLLAEGKVVGVARGRTEFGPRALGHRSLLSYPFADAKHKMNVIKAREWWRPVAPMVASDDVANIFERGSEWGVLSPYMSKAPRLTEEVLEKLPAIVHFDLTARPQIVLEEDDPWIYRLLLEVKRLTGGMACVINTSFNTRGKPILNRAAEALELLLDSDDLDAVVIGSRLVVRQSGPRADSKRGD